MTWIVFINILKEFNHGARDYGRIKKYDLGQINKCLFGRNRPGEISFWPTRPQAKLHNNYPALLKKSQLLSSSTYEKVYECLNHMLLTSVTFSSCVITFLAEKAPLLEIRGRHYVLLSLVSKKKRISGRPGELFFCHPVFRKQTLIFLASTPINILPTPINIFSNTQQH